MSKPASTPWQLLLFWTALILSADLIVAVTAWRQHASAAFPTTTAKIAQSRLGQGALGQRGLMLRYTYTVGGVRYTGSRYRYDDENVSLRFANVVDEFQPLSLHLVFYNPRDPRDSVLSPGVEGSDWVMMLAATPFNVATGAVWFSLLARRRRARTQNAGFKIVRRDRAMSIRLSETSAPAVACYAFAGAAAAAASIAIIVRGVDVTPRAMAESALAALAIGLVAGLLKFINNNSGRFDLTADGDGGPLTLPATAGRRSRLTVPRADLAGIAVRRRVSRIPSGLHYSFVPALSLGGPGGATRTVPLVTWGWDESAALKFGQWLSGALGARFIGVEDEEPVKQAV